MGKKIKKQQMGPSTEFVTRSYALKKLQISLKDFRRLCILKGIYPRVPSKAPKGSDKVYYDIKDLSHLAHEPLLAQFREFKTFMKKIRKAAGRNQFTEARRKNDIKPELKLDHLVKERYPRFIDALRDLDDALSMIHLFAALPSVGRITPEKTNHCKELVRQWQYYIARSKSLTKVFVSVKGVYFQCEIMGEPITWLQPHSFTQSIPNNIDFRVMITFLDFYEVFLKFVLFKLYSSISLSYPPVVDSKLDASSCFLLAVKSKSDSDSAVEAAKESEPRAADAVTTDDTKDEKSNSKSKSKMKKSKLTKMESKIEAINQQEEDFDKILAEAVEEDDDDENEVDISQPLANVFAELHGENNDDDGMGKDDEETFNKDDSKDNDRETSSRSLKDELGKLFKNLVFFANRETPLEWLQLCVISCGGNIGWDGPDSPYLCDDSSITHQVVDRPIQGIHQKNTREYIQPQWVFDSINAMVCLPIQKYRPGAILPPHLSPFVDDAREGYTPQYRKDLDSLVSTVAVQKGIADASQSAKTEEESDENEEASDSEEEFERDVEAERHGVSYSTKQIKKKAADQDSDASEEGNESNDEEEEEEDEDEDEEDEDVLNNNKQKGVVYAPQNGNNKHDESSLPHIMMNKKTKRLYGRMQHGLQKKKDEISRLETKRKELENTSSGAKKSKKQRK